MSKFYIHFLITVTHAHSQNQKEGETFVLEFQG